jgi:hypothetical protein
MRTKLLRKVKKKYSIYKYTKIDKRSRLYDLTRLNPTEEKPVYIALDNYEYFIPVIHWSEDINVVKEKLLKHIIEEYKYKFPRNRNNFEKKYL